VAFDGAVDVIATFAVDGSDGWDDGCYGKRIFHPVRLLA